MKYLWIIIAIVICVILLVVIIGALLPVKHTASVQLSLDIPAGQVWERLNDVKAYPQWRKSLRSVDIQSDSSWIEEDGRNHRLPLKIISAVPLHTLITKIDGKGLPFGGTWTFQLEPGGQQTIVTITENGEVYNPVFRFVSAFIIGHSATIKQYARDLEGSFK